MLTELIIGRSLAERVSISLAPDPDIKIETAFRLTPSPQPVSIESDPILLEQLQVAARRRLLRQPNAFLDHLALHWARSVKAPPNRTGSAEQFIVS